MTEPRSFGPVTIHSGRRSDLGTEFDASLGAMRFRVEVVDTPDGTAARWVDPPAGEASGAAAVTLHFPVSDLAHGALTLPVQRDVGWGADPADEPTIELFAGGAVKEWLKAAGGATSTSCDVHAPKMCVSFPPSQRGVAVVAVAATRVRPVVTGRDFGALLPWDTPSPRGSRASHVHARGSGSGTLVEDLELYDKLVDAVESATRDTVGYVEYGIVEHHFAFANVDDYRFLYERFGHISADHPKGYTLSGYLGQLLGILSRDDQLTYLPGHGTGYWSYNSTISNWGLPRAPKDAVQTWAAFAESKGWHPMNWPAVSLLWGKHPVPERTWSGHVGPGEQPPGVTADTLPRDVANDRIASFAASFDAAAAFGAEARPIAERIRKNWQQGLGLPRDVGLLRCALAQADRGEADFVDALLERIRGLL